LAIVFGFIYLDVNMPLAQVPGLWMLPIYGVLCLGTSREASLIVREAWQVPVFWSPWVVSISAALPLIPELASTLGLASWIDTEWTTVPGRLAMVCLGNWILGCLLGLHAILTYENRRQAIGWLVSLGLMQYVSVATSFWWILRHIGDQKHAMFNIVGIALVTKMADSGAYFAGKNFGRNPLARTLSPKKTWEGLVGGWACACLSALIYFCWIGNPANDTFGWKLLGAFLLGTALTWFGLLGDLIESMMKRSGDIKDSGASFAGLGGVWDVTDSLIPAGMVGLIAILLGWI
jgi:phosphatidate cytidylyltransferase